MKREGLSFMFLLKASIADGGSPSDEPASSPLHQLRSLRGFPVSVYSADIDGSEVSDGGCEDCGSEAFDGSCYELL